MTFEQWYHQVQCVKDHYLEVVGGGARVDIGPTASVDHILHQLLVIFCMVASFDVLTQDFYKVRQRSNENVPSFATRLEETLSHIQLQCLGRMMDLEAQ